MSAVYALPCPVCGGECWDQRAPGNKWPWKKGTPIAKCKDRDCAAGGGVYWEDSAPTPKARAVPGEPQYAPAPTRGPVMGASAVVVETYAELAVKHATRYLDLYDTVASLYAAKMAAADGQTAKREILATATADTINALTATIYIGMQKDGIR